MTTQFDTEEAAKFKEAAGGISKATVLIMKELNCSLSKAEKIASGRYPSKITSSEYDRLVSLMKRTIRNFQTPRQRTPGKAS